MRKFIKQLGFLSLFAVMTVFILNGCSDDDDKSGPTIEENGGDAYRLQIITIETGVSLGNEEYQGTFNGDLVTLVRVEDDKLVFVIPPDAPFGNSDLVITGLNNTKIRYNVLEQVLSESPEATMSGFITNLENFAQVYSESPDALEIQQSISSFVSVFENANSEQKTEMAKAYLANKDFIDSVFTGTAERITQDQISLIKKHSLAVGIAGVSAAGAWLAKPYGYHTAVLVTIAAVSTYSARSLLYEIWDVSWNTITAQVNSIFDRPEAPFIANRAENEDAISLSDDVETLLGFSLIGRTFDQGDSGSSNSYVQTFFNSLSQINTTKTKVNDIITWINNNIPFADFGLLELDTLDENAPETNVAVDSSIMNNLSFSVNHPNLQLVNATINNNGQLAVKVKITGTPQETPVISTLNYTYQDEFSNFSGSFPIEVSEEEQYNYQIQIGAGNYAGDEEPTPQQTISQGGNLSLPNYMRQYVRLLLDGEPVLSGNLGLAWTPVDFGTVPVSAQPVYEPNYTFDIYDSTNNRNVTFHLDLTLTNDAYGQLVGNTLKINGNRLVTFNADGTCTSVWESTGQPVTSGPTSYQWQGGSYSQSFQNCLNGDFITTKVIGVIYLPQNSATVPSYILIEEGGTFRANSYYGCPNYLYYIPIE